MAEQATQHDSMLPELTTFGLASWHGQHHAMVQAHRHNEIEINFIDEGAMTYFIAGTQVTVPTRQFALFWAAIPHQVIHWQAPATCFWLTLPLGYFLGWSLGRELTDTLLNGRLIIDHVAANAVHDHHSFITWNADLNSGNPERVQIVFLELEARLRRLALQLSPQSHIRADDPRLDSSGKLARYISLHYQEALTTAQIAAAVGLHPNYAMATFCKRFGVSMVEYITQHRISHAQRLLLTTDLPILEIAYESGFGSASRFYNAFEAICEMPPGRYRASLLQVVENRKNNLEK